VSRIVLLAGIGRGVDAEERGRWKWVLRVGRFIPFIRSSVMYDVLRGSDFVTQIRIGWIRHFSELANAGSTAAVRLPLVVQLISTEDDVLRRDDSIDLEQFPTAYHLDVPGAGDQTLHRLDLVAYPEAMIREAFVSDSLPHARVKTLRADADTVQRVLLLMHGMRSSRDEWVRLADFLATGRLSATTVNGRGPSGGISIPSQLAPWLAPVLLLLIVGVSVGWVWRAPQRSYRLTMVASAAAMTVVLLDII